MKLLRKLVNYVNNSSRNMLVLFTRLQQSGYWILVMVYSYYLFLIIREEYLIYDLKFARTFVAITGCNGLRWIINEQSLIVTNRYNSKERIRNRLFFCYIRRWNFWESSFTTFCHRNTLTFTPSLLRRCPAYILKSLRIYARYR